MRISDWSSDVCSSDLLPLAPFAGEIALIASRASVAADCSAARRLAPGALTVMSSAGMEHSTSNIWLCAAPCVTTKRSEEHTSELQSLMRISYAVFCLHKKNKSAPERRTIRKYTAKRN